MKAVLFLSLLSVGASSAGEPALLDKSPVLPPSPNLYTWFAGATGGYLIDNEDAFYALHLGVDLPNQLGPWDQALYLEVGYTKLDDCQNIPASSLGGYDPSYNESAALGAGGGIPDTPPNERLVHACANVDVIPITLNYKLERSVSNNLRWFLGAGAGVALVDADIHAEGGSTSDNDTVFYAQAFTGILYHLNPSCELFGGVRYVYFDEPDFNFDGTSVSWGDLNDLEFDVFNDDVMIDLGARINF